MSTNNRKFYRYFIIFGKSIDKQKKTCYTVKCITLCEDTANNIGGNMDDADADTCNVCTVYIMKI